MKKFIVAAMLVLGATSAFAGDSDALKAVLSAKKYSEAKELVKQNLASMASDAERAKAYNYLVKLSMDAFNKESAKELEDQIKKTTTADKESMYKNAYNALASAIECYKYDQLPDAKGKVKPKYDGNKDLVWPARIQLVNAGQDAAQKNQPENVLKYWGQFLDTENAPLFDSKVKEKEAEKDYLGQVALFAARYAYQAKDALNLKLYVMKDALKNHADSLAYVEKLKALYVNDESNDVILDGLNSMYSSLKMEKEQLELLDGAIAKNPNNFVALADKGMYYISKNDADKAIECLNKALAVQPDNVVVMTYLGACLNVKASNLSKEEGKAVYEESIKHLDKAKELDPNKEKANWGYNRFQAYYGLYGPNDAKTKAAEEESH